jgi:hypothetical protein
VHRRKNNFPILGMIGTCAFLVAIGYMKCNHIGAVTCCVFAVGFLGFQTCGPIISHLDVASNYAGKTIDFIDDRKSIE